MSVSVYTDKVAVKCVMENFRKRVSRSVTRVGWRVMGSGTVVIVMSLTKGSGREE